MSEARPHALLRLCVFILVTAAVVVAGGWLLKRNTQVAAKPAAAAKGAAPVLTAKVAKENYALDLDAIGTVRAFESIDISSNVTESVTQLSFNDGDFVKKGTLLALLSDAEEQAMLASAKATLAEEEREIERLKNLVKDGAAPEARLAERKTLADIAKQKIFEAEARLTDRRITAPFDGWLGLRRISVGALVTPGSIIASLDKIDVVKIDFSVPETYLGSVKAGTLIEARTDTDRERKYAGKVSHLDSRIDPVTRSIPTRAEVANPDLALKPGMLVMVRLVVEPKFSLSIPERALVPVGAKAFVFSIQDDKAKRVEVKTGRRKPGFVEIQSGLSEGQLIIADGIVGLQDGAAVKVAGDYGGPVKAFNPEQPDKTTP
ncbi:MAG: efflux RND transporter periplasmic adaptor subunit [Prosthecobacter sp.]|uniref:efflux RND transporter periplasmic adaptor subunit n=1 Tax=Prosthecobacter sp. TaxID=1965333 RepID=UPI0039011F3B